MKIFILILGLLLSFGCTKSAERASDPTAEAQPSPKSENFTNHSAAEQRRGLAVAQADTKKFDNNFYYSCDREKLPRTCCYYLRTLGGDIHSSGLSCTEENH